VTTGPDAAKLRRQLGAMSWVVLEEMMERSTGDGDHVVAKVSIRSLASSLGLAKDTVARAVRRLSDLGVIEAVQVRASSGVFEAGSYRLTVPASFVSVACPPQPPAAPSSSRSSARRLPGPWEWDLKRLAGRFTIAARSIGLDKRNDSEAAQACAETYRTTMAEFAAMSAIDTGYASLTADDIVTSLRKGGSKAVIQRAKSGVAKARSRTSLQAARKLTRYVDGRLRIVDDPPLVMPLSTVVATDHIDDLRAAITENYRQYRETLPSGPRHVLDDYHIVDIAHKVVGVGSVGLRAFIGLLQSRRTGEPLLLQVKEATTSVLEPHLEPSRYEHPGQRVVEGQRMMQAASDMFLGWSTSVIDGRHYYWRQLRDMKGSADIEASDKSGLTAYARMCGWSLARAHARSGEPAVIAGYLGKSDTFDRAIAEFARRYAAQNDADFTAHAQAIADGSIPATSGV
jgi:uncharacterized protein (DUF2252 family)